ncbi:MAG: amidohydrolase family protein [Candidatus Baltobacteraceae bacterium]
MSAPLLVLAGTIVTCDTDAPQNGVTFEDLNTIRDGALLCSGGTIDAIGPRADIEPLVNAARERYRIDVADFRDCILVPGFVDAHAHPLFAGDREADFAARVAGQKPPLGMLYTVERTREALDDEGAFERTILSRLSAIAAHGTTTLETKTGYALHKPGEMQLLDLIARCNDDAQLPGTRVLPRLIATFLGAHTLPPEFSTEKDYVDYLIDQCLPFAKAHGAVYADAFCEPGFFSPGQTRRYLEAARANGLRLRVHCDEMQYGGAAGMAVVTGVDAVDHCNCIREADVRAIAQSGTITVACPATIAYLDLPQRTPVRDLLQAGGCVALGSDYNPGTSPCFNLQTVAYFGRALFGLTAAEALYGVTIAAAASLHANAGVLRSGGPADFVALELDSPSQFGWTFGGNLARSVYVAGRRAE